MKPTVGDKFTAYLALLSGLALSAVAIYYSVVGLTAIFAAAVIPIIIMGTVLEVGKIVATIWLKQNWKIAPFLIKLYLMIAIFILMVITSMGIFGFLSKAHLDQTVPTGDVVNQLNLIDEKVKVERDNIDVARKALKQLDDAVDQTMARSTTEQGASRSAQLRRNQARERSQLQTDIANAQEKIRILNEEKIPLASQLRKVEAEVGPIKYIASFFYGQTDQIILEKSVTWVIIILILVFDPLAVILLLASQSSFQSFEKYKEISKLEPVQEIVEPKVEDKAKQTIQENIIQPDIQVKTENTSTDYVQNEEQKESNLWSSTVKSTITEQEYLQKAKQNLKGK